VATLTYSIGFANAEATLSSFDDTQGPLPTGSGTGSTTGSDVGPGSPNAPQASAFPVVPDSGLDASAPLTGTGAASSPPQVAAGTSPAAVNGLSSHGLSTSQELDLGNIYLALVVSGLLALGVGQLVRYFGVRTVKAT
jgi:hypothetical protein